MTLSAERETVESQPDPERARVDAWLIEIQALREGRLDTYRIHDLDTESEIELTPENFIAVETRIREIYSEQYPDLAVIDAEAVEIRGELNPGPQPIE
jgi:hypothetical protein